MINKKAARISIIIICALPALAVLSLLGLGIYTSIQGKKDLEEIRSEIITAGGKIHPDEFDVADEVRIGTDFNEFVERLDDYGDLHHSIEMEFGYLRHNNELIGEYLPIHSATAQEHGLKEGKTWGALQLAAESLRQDWGTLSQLAFQKDIQYIPDYANGGAVKMDHLSPVLNVAKFCSFLASLEIQRGDLDSALNYLETGKQMYTKITPLPDYSLISGLVRVTIDSIFMQHAQFIITHPKVTQSHLKRIHALYADSNGFKIIEKSLEGERVLMG
ncbi:MAG: hypothetical protein AAFY98_11220, partial [Verrucomicrobiota bacterium]